MAKQTSMNYMILTAAVAGLLVSGVVYRLLSHQQTAEAQIPREASLVLAKTNLNRGTVLTGGHLRTQPHSRSPVPLGAFTRPELVIGRIVREPISAESPILETSLAPLAQGGRLGTVVPEGFRAIGISIDGRGGIQRYLQPGDRIDVVVAMEDAEGVTSSKLLLQDITVLSVPGAEGSGTGASRSNEPLIPIVVAAVPWDAEKLSLAMHVGTLHALVRGNEDSRLAYTSGVTRDTLVPTDAASPSEAAAKTTASSQDATTYQFVEVINGQQRHKERFPTKALRLPEGG